MNFEMKWTQDIFGYSSLKSKAMDFITPILSRGSTSLSGQFFNKLLTIHRTKHNVVFLGELDN